VNSGVLVLNSGFIPLEIRDVKDAICLLVMEKAYPVIETDKYIRSPSVSIRIPSVIALLAYGNYVHKRVKFSRLNVMYRDDLTCQYCGSKFLVSELTVDHLVPRSRWKEAGTPTKWNNVVTACKRCNSIKGNRLITEIGWKILKQPEEPKYLPHLVISYPRAEKMGWLPFCGMNVRLIETIKKQ